MSSPLDSKLCQELADYIEMITHSGQKTLDAELMKKVKNICKSDEGYVEHVFHLSMHQLKEKHSEVRLSAFGVIDELFRRSHRFRELCCRELQVLLESVAETNPSAPLPPPRAAALALRHSALRTFGAWHQAFAHGYKELQVAFNFLTKCKKVDFENLEFESSLERARAEEAERRQKQLNEEKRRDALAQFSEVEEEIQRAVKTLESCCELLLPPLDDFFIAMEGEEPEEEASDKGYDEEQLSTLNVREHGLLNPHFSVDVQVKQFCGVQETPENAAVFENVRDMRRLIHKKLFPSVKKWLQVVTKCSGSAEEVKRLVGAKEALESALHKALQVGGLSGSVPVDSDSASDLEEVPEKEGYEPLAKEPPLPPSAPSTAFSKGSSSKEWSICSGENHKQDPTSLVSTLEVVKGKGQAQDSSTGQQLCPVPSTSKGQAMDTQQGLSRKQRLLCVAPRLPFDVDLYHWEEKDLKAPTMLMVKPDSARFWSATSTDEMQEVQVPEGAAALRTRVMEFSGRQEPIKWACRAPLPTGGLCPRKDRNKCPFHGPIVARDAEGNCSNAEDQRAWKEAEDKRQRENPDWQHPTLLKEIKDATGVDLKMPAKGKRRRRTKEGRERGKFPALTDIKAKQNNAYTRLARKVFRRATMKRVAESLDKADHRRFRDKFGDQFNYVHDTL